MSIVRVSLLIALSLAGSARAACPTTPDWATSTTLRNGSCAVAVAGGGDWGPIDFAATLGGDHKLLPTGSLGRCPDTDGDGKADPCNRLYYQATFDGYSGRPIGQDHCATPADGCTGAGREVDEFETNYIRGLHYFLKNVTIKNGFTFSSTNPHLDLFQTLRIPYRTIPKGNWLVLQDVVLRNSDQQHLHMGETLAINLLFQNVTLEQEEAFTADCRHRRAIHGSWGGCECSNNCSYNIGGSGSVSFSEGAGSSAKVVWMIDVKGNRAHRIRLGSGITDVIIIGSKVHGYNELFEGREHFYASIEEALAAGWSRPPFIHLSSAGWSSPPGGTGEKPPAPVLLSPP